MVIAGLNSKTVNTPNFGRSSKNSGNDVAGIVHAVGKKFCESKVGDRVTALHRTNASEGYFVEHAAAPGVTTFYIP